MLRVSGGITDEGFSGARVRDTENRMRFSKEGAEFLSTSIRGAIQASSAPGMTNRNVLSQNISTLSESLGKNTEAVQNIIETQGDETRNEFKKLVDMMAASQKKTGDASIGAIKELVKQIEKIKIAAGDRSEELVDALSLQKTQDDLVKQLSRKSVGATIFEKVTSVDPRGQSILDSLKQTFSVEKMFGVKPSQSAVRERISAEMAQAGQGSSLADVVDATTVEAKVEKLKDSKQAEATKTSTNADGAALVSGIDRKSPQVQQVDLLKEILQQLKDMESGGGLGLASMLALPAVGAAIVTAAKVALGVIFGAAATTAILKAMDWWKNYNQSDFDEFANRPENIGKTDEELTKALRVENGMDSAASDPNYDMTQDPAYPLFKAKRTGLYDKDYIGNSEVDLNMLAATTDTAQLQAILDDNDLSDTDRMRVSRRLEQIKRETPVTPEIVPKDGPKPEGEPVSELAPIGVGAMPTLDSNGNVISETAGDATAKTSTTPFVMNIKPKDVLGFAAELNFQNMISPAITPTADAVGNMSSSINDTITQIVNNIYNTNNTTGSGGAASVTVNTPMTARDTDPSFRVYQLQKLSTR